MQTVHVSDFDSWRTRARTFLQNGSPPDDLIWEDAAVQSSLFADAAPKPVSNDKPVNVPAYFLDFAKRIATHRDGQKWALLYRALWRITHGERYLFKISTDPLMHKLFGMDKEIRRDAHKTKAFVRFRKVEDDLGEHYIAWHKPDHRVLPIVAPFFKNRFSVMRWTIMTPDETLNWDGEKLHWGKGVPSTEAPAEDRLEDLWRDYYRATFNPARIKINTMKREMPVRHWATLPETSIIADMLAEAPTRVQKMIEITEGNAVTAADYLPEENTYPTLKRAALSCQGCDLFKCATQTVFGEGPLDARLMIVGEQPGNDEDLQGRVFVGPAGRVLDKALAEVGLDRSQIYITNAVKHFKFRLERERRMHRSPDAREINACKPWLMSEIELITPQYVLCMGASAGKSLVGHGFTLKKERGKWFDGPAGAQITATYHPSAVLRNEKFNPGNDIYDTIVRDLKKMKDLLGV